jgi:hypothetical protein
MKAYKRTEVTVGNSLVTLFLSKELPVSTRYVYEWASEPVLAQ